MPRAFLLCGIGWDQMEVLIPDAAKREEATTRLKAALEGVRKQFAEAGCDYEQVNYSPKESLDRWEGIITGKKWDGIVIGGGIRGQYPQLCQDLINHIVEKSPQSKILFNTTPGDTFDVAKRQFPDI